MPIKIILLLTHRLFRKKLINCEIWFSSLLKLRRVSERWMANMCKYLGIQFCEISWFFYHSSEIFAMVRSAPLSTASFSKIIWFDFDLINFFLALHQFGGGRKRWTHIQSFMLFSHDWLSWFWKMISCINKNASQFILCNLEVKKAEGKGVDFIDREEIFLFHSLKLKSLTQTMRVSP